MNHQNIYSSGTDYVVEMEYEESPKKRKRSSLQNWLALSTPSLESAIRQAEADSYHALLTTRALRHTIALSVIEREAIDVAPQGAYRYREIVDGYADTAAHMIRRWR